MKEDAVIEGPHMKEKEGGGGGGGGCVVIGWPHMRGVV